MSSVTRPRGPLPPRVYWTRRALVLGVALALVFGIARVLDRGADGTEDDTAKATTVSGTQATPPSDTASPGGGPVGAETGKNDGGTGKGKGEGNGKKRNKPKKPRQTPLPQPSGPCLPSDVVVTPVVEDARAGGDIPVTLRFTSKLSEACTVAVSSGTVVLRLTSGNDKIWSSQQCPKAVAATTVIARKQVPGEVVVIWNGQRSNDECSRTTAWALPGYYHAEAAVLGGEATDVQFRLRLPTPETITPKPKPKKNKKPRD